MSTATIIIAEDNADIRRLLKWLVKDLVAAVFECENGAQAVVAYEQHKPDWVLMDIEMAEMDGLTATAKILAAHPQARIVIVTQHADKSTRENALKIGAWAFMSKENLVEVRSLFKPE